MQKKKGISLIVLVITIIVMIILAGAIILSLNNAGIIEKANQAVKDTDEATVKEIAQMAWAEAYADGVRKVEDTEVNGEKVEGFETRVKVALTANGVDTTETSKYLINVTEKGVTVKLLAEAWVQEGLKIKRGQEELDIGETVKYEAGVDGYTGGWKVLGADEEGNLLIMSAVDVKSYSLGSRVLSEAQTEWLRGVVVKLDNECVPYGNGEGAISARSINVEDIDKMVGFDKTTYVSSEEIDQYNNEVTYKYDGTLYPTYDSSNGIKDRKVESEHSNGFYWHDEDGFHSVTEEDLTNKNNKGKEIAKVKTTYYGYTITSGSFVGTEAYNMIFGANNNFWLNSTYILTRNSRVSFGVFSIGNGKVDGGGLWYSTGEPSIKSRGVRAVVTISSDIHLDNLI